MSGKETPNNYTIRGIDNTLIVWLTGYNKLKEQFMDNLKVNELAEVLYSLYLSIQQASGNEHSSVSVHDVKNIHQLDNKKWRVEPTLSVETNRMYLTAKRNGLVLFSKEEMILTDENKSEGAE